MEKETITGNTIWWHNKGFYDEPSSIENSIEITQEYWKELIDGQSSGMTILEDENGYPILKGPDQPTEQEIQAGIFQEVDRHETQVVRPRHIAINGYDFQMSKEGRLSLMQEVVLLRKHGKPTISFWAEDRSANDACLSPVPIEIIIPLDEAEKILEQWEFRAKEVLNITQRHKQRVASLPDVQSKKQYDYSTGYPATLEFEI